MKKASPKQILWTLLILAVAYGVRWIADGGLAGIGTEPAPRAEGGAGGGVDVVEEAFRNRRNDVPVDVTGTVVKILPDDTHAPRHQRFLLKLSTGRTLLVAHNIDLAPRVPLRRGAEVSVRGDYEHNEKGGVLHWTHHDPRGRHREGWIRYEGKTYK